MTYDNASKDNSVEIFQKEFGKNKKIRIIKNPENLGYAGGNNEGVKHAKGEYIVILNNDTLVEKDWLKWLVKGIESDEKIGAVSSIDLKEGQSKETIMDFNRIGSTTSLLGYHAKYRLKEPLESDASLVNSFGIRGVSFIYRKNIVDLPFDPDYFIYAEDLYFGWLLNLREYRNKTATKSILYHFHNTSKKKSKKTNKYFIYLGERNRLINLFIFYERKNLIKIFPLIVLGIFMLNFFEFKKIPYRSRSYLWLLTHYKDILKKREKIQKQRKVSDNFLIEKMSCKFYDESMVKNKFFERILKFINYAFCLYCKALRIKTIELT